jgi:hypothetical protein
MEGAGVGAGVEVAEPVESLVAPAVQGAPDDLAEKPSGFEYGGG